MNLILENSKHVKFHTFLDDIFTFIPEFREYNWLLSDLEFCGSGDPRLHGDAIIINGASLNEIIQKEQVQFIWSVFSGFKKEITRIPETLPYAEDNENLWLNSPKTQL